MAIRLRHAEFLAIFFVCFLPILLVYYPLLAVSVDHAKDGAVPAAGGVARQCRASTLGHVAAAGE